MNIMTGGVSSNPSHPVVKALEAAGHAVFECENGEVDYDSADGLLLILPCAPGVYHLAGELESHGLACAQFAAVGDTKASFGMVTGMHTLSSFRDVVEWAAGLEPHVGCYSRYGDSQRSHESLDAGVAAILASGTDPMAHDWYTAERITVKLDAVKLLTRAFADLGDGLASEHAEAYAAELEDALYAIEQEATGFFRAGRPFPYEDVQAALDRVRAAKAT